MIDLTRMRAASGIGQNMPNIIGNQEDKDGSSTYAPSSKPIYDPNKSGGDERMFQSVTPRRTEA